MKEIFQTIEVLGHSHVIKEASRKPQGRYTTNGDKIEPVELPNYRGSGMALCGVLKKGQTLKQFIHEFNEKKARLNAK